MTTNLNKTLEQLDKEDWKESAHDITGLIKKVHLLRKKPLKHFTTEDLRLIIGQSFCLDYLIPIAIDRLKENILAEGDLYEGDLLHSILGSDINYWTNHKDQWQTVKQLYADSRHIFDSNNTYRKIRKSYEQFENI